ASGESSERFLVCLFSGQEGYTNYIAGLGVHVENTLGVYFPDLKQLLIWNQPQRERMFETIRHEGFHQYFDRITHNAPRWLNEGLAKYFQVSELVNGRWKDGIVPGEHLRALSEGALVPLSTFLRMDATTFYSRASLHYAEAWAFVHFLQN